MTLAELSIADMSALMAHLSRKMSQLKERTPENTKAWEVLAFQRGCIGTEFQKRVNEIQFPKSKNRDIEDAIQNQMSKEEEQEWDALNDNTDWMSDEQIREAGLKIREKYARLKNLRTL